MAVIITIMAFQILPPSGDAFGDLRDRLSTLLAYVLSFAFVGIYWNNHHHLFRSLETIDSGVMWANMHFLFWLSLIPSSTTWIGEHPWSAGPAALYGIVGLGAGAAFNLLGRRIASANRNVVFDVILRARSKGVISVVLYGVGVGLAFVHPFIAYGCYAAVSIMWFAPETRLLATTTTPATSADESGQV